jgi:hypothetical protein
MVKQIGTTDKEIVCLICQNLKKSGIDINKMIHEDKNQAVEFLYKQYKMAKSHHQFLCVTRESRFSPAHISK